MIDEYRKNRYCPCMRCRMNCMMGPALMITIGTLWLISDLRYGHGMTLFAVFLIVIGGVKMLQSSASTEGHQRPYPNPYPTGDVPPAMATPQTEDRQVNNNG